MIKAIFNKKYFWNVICLLCGLFLIGLFIVLSYIDSESTLSDLLTGIIFAALICIVNIVCLFYNYKAYLYVDDNGHIKGKYHYFSKIDSRISDVEFASEKGSTLIIRLKNGKTHTITGIENSWSLASVIRRNMPFEPTEQPEILIDKLNSLKSAGKKDLIYVCAGSALMFINIFVTIFLTDERELDEFSNIDWTIFIIMGIIELATIIATFYFAQKIAKNHIATEKLQYAVKRTIIETKPLPLGFVTGVYTDDNYIGRITVMGYRHQSAVYYSVQEFDSEYNLIQVYTSDTYKSQEELPEGFESLIDITKKVLH